MKDGFSKLASLLTALLLIVSLSACATTPREETTRVKCPACGYEFAVPADGGG